MPHWRTAQSPATRLHYGVYSGRKFLLLSQWRHALNLEHEDDVVRLVLKDPTLGLRTRNGRLKRPPKEVVPAHMGDE